MQHQYLYLSRLADAGRYDVFAPICQVSRVRNHAAGLGGVLLFDGQRFCQLIEGPSAAATALMRSIAADTRHETIAMLIDRPWTGAPQPRAWTSGYCGPDELDRLDSPDAPRGDAALAAFIDIVSRSDLAP